MLPRSHKNNLRLPVFSVGGAEVNGHLTRAKGIGGAPQPSLEKRTVIAVSIPSHTSLAVELSRKSGI